MGAKRVCQFIMDETVNTIESKKIDSSDFIVLFYDNISYQFTPPKLNLTLTMHRTGPFAICNLFSYSLTLATFTHGQYR